MIEAFALRARRGAGAAAVFATCGAFAVACGGSSSDDSSGSSSGNAASGGKAQVEFLSVQHATEGWPLVLSTLTGQYAKQHPGSSLKNTYVPQDTLIQRLQLLSGQDALPVLYNTPPTADQAAKMEQAGQMADLEPEFKKLGVLDELNPAAVNIVKSLYGGKLVALPLELNIEGLWYNKQLFSRNGITPPQTWDELVQAADKLNAKGIQPFAASGKQGWPLTRLIGDYLFRKLGPDALQKVADKQAKL